MSGVPAPGNWRKSSRSGNSDCVEWRVGHDGVQVRDSKNPEGPVLTYSHSEWHAFLFAARAGEADIDATDHP
jgi:hypothetical protein